MPASHLNTFCHPSMQKCPRQVIHAMHLTLQVDQGGSGVLTPAAIGGFLTELGLEPTSIDVLHIIDELDWSGSGVVSRYAVPVSTLLQTLLMQQSIRNSCCT